MACKDSSQSRSNNNALSFFEQAPTFVKVRGSQEVLLLLMICDSDNGDCFSA
jgi:hypothetical protein